jgi:8-oxo-dGTP pyrophosphatase MutT (NUDIX family)
LTPDLLRDAFARPLIGVDGGDFDLNPVSRPKTSGLLKAAAVLVPVVARDQGLTLLLTKRTETLSSHAGQISFPGGRVDETDLDPRSAALREAHEEVGLPPSHVEVIGELPSYQTGSGYQIKPVVGIVRPGFNIQPQLSEVADVFELPLMDVLAPANHQVESRLWNDMTVHFYVIPVADRRVWGATAGIIVSLSRQLGLRS